MAEIQKYGQGADFAANAKVQFDGLLVELEGLLRHSGGPYIYGRDLSAADCALGPRCGPRMPIRDTIERISACDHHLIGVQCLWFVELTANSERTSSRRPQFSERVGPRAGLVRCRLHCAMLGVRHFNGFNLSVPPYNGIHRYKVSCG